MAGVDRGTGLIFAEAEASAFARAYLTGLGFENGFGAATGQPLGVGASTTLLRNVVEFSAGSLTGTHTAVARAPVTIPVGTEIAVATVNPDRVTGIDDTWWERVHILLRSVYDFGLVITQEELTFEMYNAHRTDTVTLSSIVNLAGVLLPDSIVSDTMPPGTSMLRNTTTGNTGVVLGTMVLLRVQAPELGPSSFDSDLVFDFLLNSVSLSVLGFRVILIPFRYELPMKLAMEFLTDGIVSASGSEQRLRLRSVERESYEVLYRLTGVERQYMHSILFDTMNKLVGVPAWQDEVVLKVATTVGATSYTIAGGDDVDFRVGGLALAITDNYTFDVLNIVSVTDTTLVAADPSLNAFPVGTPIVPIRTAIMSNPAPTRRPPVLVEDFQIKYLIEDSSIGVVAGSTTPGFWSLLDGKVFFDNCNTVKGNSNGAIGRRVTVIDNKLGKRVVSSVEDRSKRRTMRRFTLHSRAEIKEFRSVWRALGGRGTSFYVPSDIEDMTPIAPLVFTANTMDISSIGYGSFIGERGGMNRIRIKFNDGTSLLRGITSSTELTSSTERLVVDDTWSVTRPLNEIVRVEFIDLVTSDIDRLTLNYERVGYATVELSVTRAFS